MFEPVSIDLEVPLSRKKKQLISGKDAAVWLESMRNNGEPFASVISKKKAERVLGSVKFAYTLVLMGFIFYVTVPAAVIVWSIAFAALRQPFTGAAIQMSYVLPTAFAASLIGLIGISADLRNKQSLAQLKELQLEGLRSWFATTHSVSLPQSSPELDAVVTHLLAGDRSQGWKAVIADSDGQHWQLQPTLSKKQRTTWSAHKVEAPSSIEQGAQRITQ